MVFPFLKRKHVRKLHSPVAEVVRYNNEIAAHLEKFRATEADAWIAFDKKQFPSFAAGIMWNCSLQIFDRISSDSALVAEFDSCGGDLLFLECAIFPPIAIMTLENKELLGSTVEFESFYEVLELIYSELEVFFRAQQKDLPEFQQQRVEYYMFMEEVNDWFKAVCSMFYQLLRARSLCTDASLDAELKPMHPLLEGNFYTSMDVQLIAESELSEALAHLKRVIYEFSDDGEY